MNANELTITANNGTNNNENNNASTGDSASPVAGNSDTHTYDLLDPFEEKPEYMCVYTRKFTLRQKNILKDFNFASDDIYLTEAFCKDEHLDPNTIGVILDDAFDFFLSGSPREYHDALAIMKIDAEIKRVRDNSSCKFNKEINSLIEAKDTFRQTGWYEEWQWSDCHPELLWHADEAKKVYDKKFEAEVEESAQEYIMELNPEDPDFYIRLEEASNDRGIDRVSGFLALVLQTDLGASLKIPVKFNNRQVEHIYQFLKRYFVKHGHRVNIFGFPEHEFTETTLTVRVTITNIYPDNMTPIELIFRNMILLGATSYSIECLNREKLVGRVRHFTFDWWEKLGLGEFCKVSYEYSDEAKTRVKFTFNMENYEDYEQFVFNEEKDEYEIPRPQCKYGLECGLFGCTDSHPLGFVSRARPPRAPLTGGGSRSVTHTVPVPVPVAPTTGGGSRSATHQVPVPVAVPIERSADIKIGGGSGTRSWTPVATVTDAPVAIDTTRASKAHERLAAIANTRVEQESTVPKYCLQADEVPPPVWDFSPKSRCIFGSTCTNSKCTYVHLTERRKSDNTLFMGCNCAETTKCTVPNCHLFHGTPSVAVPVCITSGCMPPVTSGKGRNCRFGEKGDGSGCTNQKCTNIHRFRRFKSSGEPVWFDEVCSLGPRCTRPDCQWLHPQV